MTTGMIMSTIGMILAVFLGYLMGYMHGFMDCMKKGVQELNHTLRAISKTAAKDKGE